MEGMEMKEQSSFWTGKRVLLTGHSGFKGSWLSLWLSKLGANITGISLLPNTEPNLFSLAGVNEITDSHFVDIRDENALRTLVKQVAPDIIFHLAAQPLVRAGYRQPLETFSTNIIGTANLLESVRGVDAIKVAVMITTDKVYQDQKWAYPYREIDRLGGHDPYSASKAASEIVIASYRDSYLTEQGTAIATARAGNVIGGGDWSEDRLIPDAIRAWQAGKLLDIRRPQAIRPWQHVLEPLAGYLLLAEKLWSQSALAGAYNFGPTTDAIVTVREVIEYAKTCYGRGRVNWHDDKDGPHETSTLALEVIKARTILGVVPKWTLRQAISHTMNWYSKQLEGSNSRELCYTQIADYERAQ